MATLAPPEIPIDAAAVQSLPADMMQLIEESDFAPVWRKAMYDLEKDHRGFFAGEHTPDGVPWFPLAESTLKKRAHRGFFEKGELIARVKGAGLIHAPILRDTGRLAQSLTSGGLTTAGDWVREIVDEGMNKGFSFGTSVPYGHFHQDGTSKIPKREFAGFTEDRLEQIEQDLLDHIEQLITGG